MQSNPTHIVLGIDQSYHRCGICLLAKFPCGMVVKKYLKSLDLSKLKSKTEKRSALKKQISTILEKTKPLVPEGHYLVLIERIRQFNKGFINMDYIKSIGAINATIVDTCSCFGLDVFSVDTRAWKSKVVGTSKPENNNFNVNPKKWPTIQWCISQGWEKNILIQLPEKTKKKKETFVLGNAVFEYDNDAADASAIAMFGFIGGKNRMVKES